MTTCRLIINGALRKLGRLGAGREPRTADQTDALAALQGLYGAWVTSGAFGRLRDVIPTYNYTAIPGERVYRYFDSVKTVQLPDLVPNKWWYWSCDEWAWESQLRIDYTKASTESLYFAYDFTSRLGGNTISSIKNVTCTPAGLVKGAVTITGSIVNVNWSGGINGAIYATSVIILDSAGETLETDGVISVKDPQYNNIYANQTTPRDGSVISIIDDTTGNTETFIYSGVSKQWQGIDSLQLDNDAPLSNADTEGLSAILAVELADMFGADVGQTTALQARRFATMMTSRFSHPREEIVGVYF